MDNSASSKEMLEDSMKFPPNDTVIEQWKFSYKISFSRPFHHHQNTSDTGYYLFRVYHSDCFTGIVNLIHSASRPLLQV